MSAEIRDYLHASSVEYYRWAKTTNVAKEGIRDLAPILLAQRGRFRAIAVGNFGDPDLRREVMMFVGFVLQPDAFSLCIESYAASRALPGHGRGDLEKRFAAGDPDVTEALTVSTIAPDALLVVTMAPFRYQGTKTLIWGDEQRHEENFGNVPDDMIAGLAAREAGLAALTEEHMDDWQFSQDDFMSVLTGIAERFHERDVAVGGVHYGDDGEVQAQWN
jgi:hypothetical protein